MSVEPFSETLKQLFIQYKITDYLNSLGYTPVRESSDKIVYKCPLHGKNGLDNVPSFFVFTSGEYETFYCFGCNKGINIITLISEIEGKSTNEVLRDLLLKSNISVDTEGILKQKLLSIGSEKEIIPIDIERIYLSINIIIRKYLEGCKFDDVEVDFCEKIAKQIDILNQRFDYYKLVEVKDKILMGLSERADRRLEMETE